MGTEKRGAPVIEGSIFGPWGPVTIWDSGDTGEVIDYHRTDLSPSLFSPPYLPTHPIERCVANARNLYLAAATEMHPRLNGGRAFNGAPRTVKRKIYGFRRNTTVGRFSRGRDVGERGQPGETRGRGEMDSLYFGGRHPVSGYP